MLRRISAVCWLGAEIAKSSTWCTNTTRLPSITPEYKHGL
jgi:hypothetical protein